MLAARYERRAKLITANQPFGDGLGGAVVAGLGVLAPYQTVFRLAAIALLGAGLWLAYTRRPVVADGAACAPSRSAGWTKPVLWAGAAVLAVVLSEPVWARWLA